ncbi:MULTISPECIES: alpha/beta fold hydrolase [unclassified Streptomyces]|uniref:alpha/beta fold hydrolase n=1 Tax=unclassified Streptomyces TaxID=2593676 RepID=UPI0036A26F92
MNGPRVALLHGLAGTTAVWRACRAAAPEGSRFVPVDISWPAHGTAGPRAPEEPAELVARALRATRAQVVVAHSFAATALLEYLVREEGAGPPLLGAVCVSPFYRAERRDFDWATIDYYLTRFHLILEEGLAVTSGGRLSAATRASMARRVRERIGPYGWMDFFGAYLRTPGLPLDRVRTPVLAVTGAHDLAARPSDAAALVRALPAGRLHVLPGCGHFPMAEQPDRFTGVLSDFLASLPAAPVASLEMT